ncbi:MAG: cysteine desulfurase family protein [Candidatus Algichlamydia australiensis]|nr:cysteine desulfurase family protein [Chlamydiales bacterium]
MHEVMKGFLANPSSVHGYGRSAKKLLTECRARIASSLKCKDEEILFTSGGTESMNLLIHGLYNPDRPRIISSKIEHSCVFEALKRYKQVDYLPVTTWGAPTAQSLESAITPSTGLIVLSAANHETGVLLDLEAIAKIAQNYAIPLVIDGVAWFGKAPFSLPDGVAAIGFSGHKIHGPTGTGFAFLRKGHKIRSLFSGGFQERGFRPGTENLLGIVGLTKAVELLNDQSILHMRNLQKRLESALPDVNGEGPRVANVSNIAFPGILAEELLILLDRQGIAVSHGSACTAGSLEPSRILLEMGYPLERVRSSLRISFSRLTTETEIDQLITKTTCSPYQKT